MDNLTPLQAYKVMMEFLKNYYEQTLSDDIGSLLGDIRLLHDGESSDPAAWYEWLECIKKVLEP